MPLKSEQSLEQAHPSAHREIRAPVRTADPVGRPPMRPGQLRSLQMLDLQRSVGNRAASKVLRGGDHLPVQRLAPDPFTKPEKKRSLLQRGGIAIKSFFATTFGNDPSKIKPDMPNVDEGTRQEMYAIMAAAISQRDARKKDLMEKHFLPEEAAEFKANGEAFKDIPESWRPRVVTAAEWQVKRNKGALQEERLRSGATAKVQSDYATNVDKAVLKRDREHAFKASLLGKDPKEAEGLKKQHAVDLEKREVMKKSRREAQEAGNKQQEKLFEANLKTMPKDKQAAAKRVYAASQKKLEAQRKLNKYRERMTGLPPDEIDRRMKIYAEKNGLQAGLDLSDYDMAGSALGSVGGLGDVASGGSKATGEIAKVAGDSKIAGLTETMGGRSIQTQIGTSVAGGDISTSAGTLLTTANTVTSLIQGVSAKSGGDKAQQVRGDEQITDGILGLGQNAQVLGEQGMSLAKDFGGHAVDSVGLQAYGIPGFDVAANFLTIVRDGRRVVDNAHRAHVAGKLAAAAQKLKDDVLGHVVGHVRNRGIQLATHYSVDALAASLKMAGDIGILTGVGAAAGAAIKIAGTAVGGVNAAARKVADSYLAGKALAARGEAQLAMAGSADKLLQYDPVHVSQTIVDRARQGDPLALRALKSFGIDAAALKASSDANVRTVIMARLESSADPKTVTGTIGDLLGKIGGGVKAVGAGVRDVFLKPFEIVELRKVKNAVGYGGRSDRGVMWGIKQFFSGPGSVPAQKAHIKSVVEASKLEPQTKARLLAQTLTYDEKKQKKASDAQTTAVREISAPKPANLETLSAGQLETYLLRDDLSPSELTQATTVWLEKRQADMSSL